MRYYRVRPVTLNTFAVTIYDGRELVQRHDGARVIVEAVA